MSRRARDAAGRAIEDLGRVGTTVKEGVVSSLKGLNEIEAEIVTLVRNTVADSLKASADLTTVSLNVSQGRGQRRHFGH